MVQTIIRTLGAYGNSLSRGIPVRQIHHSGNLGIARINLPALTIPWTDETRRFRTFRIR